MTPFAAIVLAAGKSTRMRSKTPKALHPVGGRPMIGHVLHALEQAGAARIVVVVGFGADAIRAQLGERVEYVEQEQQMGTGHAVLTARDLLADWQGPVVVAPGDAPLLSADAVAGLLEAHGSNAATLLTIRIDNPDGYGRVLRDESGGVCGIVEERDATFEQRAITEVGVSVYAFERGFLFAALADVAPQNAQGEYYLTDTIAMARSRNRPVGALVWPDPSVGRGVNTRAELAEVDALVSRRTLRDHMLAGVTIVDPANTRIEMEVKIGADTVVWPGCVLRGVTDIGGNCEIGPGARIDDARIGDGCRVRDSWIVASEIGDGTTVGPFANIRPGSTVGADVKVGDFVELKAAVLEDHVSAGHFAYLGDATVGEGTNIGAGAITCNYDGRTKHRTTIGRRAFIGSNATLVAPVQIGDGAFVAAGSTVTDNVPDGALAIARERQTNKPDGGRRRTGKGGTADAATGSEGAQ